MSAQTRRTYRVTVEVDRRADGLPDWDSAVVTVNGTAYRYPWHREDVRATLARRAVFENYNVEQIESVESVRRREPGASFDVVAVVF